MTEQLSLSDDNVIEWIARILHRAILWGIDFLPLSLANLPVLVAPAVDSKVDTCPCVGMCGLGPCVTIDWGESILETRGGVYSEDDETISEVIPLERRIPRAWLVAKPSHRADRLSPRGTGARG